MRSSSVCPPGFRRTALRATCAVALLVSSAGAVGPRLAHAQNNKVAAEALFEEGRKLVAADKPNEACPKFADSQKLDPSVSTLLNLANCYEKAGRSASAWATYKEAASAANVARRGDLLATAQKRATAIEPTLSKLQVTAMTPIDGLEIKRDGVPLSQAEWGIAIPVDPGTHNIEATAPKKLSWATQIEVKDPGKTATLSIPTLKDAPVEPTPLPTATTTAPPPLPTATTIATTPPPPPPPAEDGSGRRNVALIVGGVGVVGLGLGTVFALSAKSKYDDSLKACGTDKNLCTQPGVEQRDSARTQGNLATVGFGVGAALVVTGAVLWFTAPRGTGDKTQLQVAPTVGGAMVRGRF